MKVGILIILSVIILTMALLVILRYDVDVNSPVVAKTDRWTGKVWIVNGGIWREVKSEMPGDASSPNIPQKQK